MDKKTIKNDAIEVTEGIGEIKLMKRQILALSCAVALLITGNIICLTYRTVEAAKKPISLSKKNITLKEGQTKKLNVKKTAKVKIKSKTFISSNKKVATVTKKTGKIKAKKAGKATLTVKVKYVKKPSKKTKTVTLNCKINVTANNTGKSEETSMPKATNTSSATSNSPAEKNPGEVTVLRKLIAEQKALGATVNEDLNDWQYTWDKEGHLVSIDWEGYGLRGNINFGGFPYLAKLNCGWVGRFEGYITNQLTGLDVSRNEKLIELYVRDNQLTNLDVSKNINLKILSCEYNKLGYLDVSKNVNLTELYCLNDQLSSLDVSKNVELEILNCGSNQLTNLDVSKNVKLVELSCFGNQLSSLDVSENQNLEYLYCQDNQLVSLNIGNNSNLYLFWDGNIFSAPVANYSNAK